MARFKKNFWNGTKRKADGDVVDLPEPEWYARQYDPTDRVTQSQGHKVEQNPRPEGVRIPRALVGNEIVPIKQAFEIYKEHNMESIRLKFSYFKIALINGTTFKTSKGTISKPKV